MHYITAAFDDLRSHDIRFLEEAARRGPLIVALLSDQAVQTLTGAPPKFPLVERQYLVESIRYVSRVIAGVDADFNLDPAEHFAVVRERDARGDESCIIAESAIRQFPRPAKLPENPRSARKKIVVTGSFDWFHSGHVRFFEEVAELGDLYVVVGHDANIRLLKGEGHPLFGQDERCYIAGSIRFVKAATISTGDGWLDAEPEIERLRPDVYAVNEDGDRAEKRDYCRANGIEYVVLKRKPKGGLPKRASTQLRGF